VLAARIVEDVEQAEQGGPVLLAQDAEDLRHQPFAGGGRHAQAGLARVGDRDELGPAVGGIRPALGQALTLQRVHDVGDGVRGQPELGRQHVLPGGSLAQSQQHLGPGHGQAASAHLVVGGPPHSLMDRDIPLA
jgi:hypothetical protein